jgi:UDP:flavonoid glycosyltransferase YjiC (YdhE family)
MPVKKLAANRLESAIRAASNDVDVCARAAELSEQMSQEDGADKAAEQIESILA